MAGLTAAAGLALAMAAQGAAPAAASGGERMIAAFAECRTIADPVARLACFDKAAGALEAAVRAKDVRIVDRADVRKAKRSLFGFTLPRINLFGGGDRDDAEEPEFSEINAVVASVRGVENGRVEFTLQGEEAVWRTTDPMPFPPRAGVKVRIRRGALGNYFVNFAGERSVRGMRVR